MKMFFKMMKPFAFLLALASLTSCAAGAATAATAGYSLKSQSADSLTADAEQRIVERTKERL